MDSIFSSLISAETNIKVRQVENTLRLLDDGATIPFISRYRKEATGGLDEVEIGKIKDLYSRFQDIAKRRQTILSTIEEQGFLTDELRKRIADIWDAALLEDIYMPYKPKRKTRAEAARQKGLAPLADLLLAQRDGIVAEREAEKFIKGEVKDVSDALKGARDIIAEKVIEDERARGIIRMQFARRAVISSHIIKGKEDEAQKYRNYFDFSEPLKRCSSHRLLAMRRGEAEGLLRVAIMPENLDECQERLERLFVRKNNDCSRQVMEAVDDACKRFILPSMETEFSSQSKKAADEEAICVFARNLKQLLLSAPLGEKRVLAIDPGFRTGCKVVCLDAQGNLLHNETIFPHPPKNEAKQAYSKLKTLVEQYSVEAIAIGNGTAGRETEQFVSSIAFSRKVAVFVVSEDGASIYSASDVAREEFPSYDVTVRGAVSIGRRLMEPLAELVKIDPKSIGVGQYQHDVSTSMLKKALEETVVSCVNAVGVNINTASKHLLTYVSGLGPQIAQNIVDFRAESGAFRSRRDLLRVPRLGAKVYEQSAGFLRIQNADNPLDSTAVHPERYGLVEQIARDCKTTVAELINSHSLREQIELKRYVSAEVGLPTLEDIFRELEKPGRDPRGELKIFTFDKNLRTINDLEVGMQLKGVVSNITNFGCFVDIGIKEKGLVHISEMADRFVSDVSAVVAIQQQVSVRVLSIDLEQKRIALTMKSVDSN